MIASLAGSADAQDINLQILLDICEGLREENPYCNELHFLGAAARERAEGIAVIPRCRINFHIHTSMYALL